LVTKILTGRGRDGERERLSDREKERWSV